MGDLIAAAGGVGAFTEASRVLLTPLDHESPDAWRRAVNRAVGDLLGADQRSFVLPLSDAPRLYSEEFDARDVARYSEGFQEADHRFGLLRRARNAGVTTRRTTWGPHLRRFYRTAYYNEVLIPLRAFDNLSAIVDLGPLGTAQLMFNHARSRGRRFGRDGRRLLRLLLPALEAGTRTLLALGRHGEHLARLVDEVGAALVLVAPDGTLLHRTPQAAGLLEDPRWAGRLDGAIRRMGRRVGAAARRHADPPAASASTASVGAGDCWIRLRATRVGSATLGPGPTVLVVLEEGSPAEPERDWSRRFGLTPRQAEVAALLARRRTNREIAELLELSRHTVRHHTEVVFAKLGVRSRRHVAARLDAPEPERDGA